MKKLLSLLGAIALGATSSAAVVSCSSDMYLQGNENADQANTNGDYKPINHAFDADITAASLVTRAKSLIVDNYYGFDDSISKDYVLNNNKVGDIVNVSDKGISDTLVGDKYSSYIDDSNLAAVAKKGELTMTGTNGDEGGIIGYAKKELTSTLVNKLPSALQGPVNAIIPWLEDILGLNKADADVADAMKPILQAMGQLNTKVAMEGIPFALGLIPDLSSSKPIFDLVRTLVKSLLDDSVKTKVSGFLDTLVKASDITQYGDDTLDKASDDIETILNRLMFDNYDTDKANSKLGDMMTFISLAGDYMSFFEHGSSEDIFKQMSDNANKKISDSIFYKANDGKGFNLAPVLNEAAYYLGNGIDDSSEGKILNLLRIMFLKTDGKTLNSIGTMIADGPFNSLMKSINPKISDDNVENFFRGVIVDDPKDPYMDKLFNGQDPWHVVYTNFAGIGGGIGTAISNNDMMQRVFLDDVQNSLLPMSLEELLKDVPIYKLLMVDASVKGKTGDHGKSVDEKDVNPGFNAPNLRDNNGLLPNYAGHYTQESIGSLARDLDSMFALESKSAKNEDLQYHYFDFSRLKDIVTDLLFADKDDGSDDSLINYLLSHITGVEDVKNKTVQNEIAQHIGYYSDGTYPNSKFVRTNSFMGKLIEALVPEVAQGQVQNATTTMVDGVSQDQTYYTDKALSDKVLGESDALKFFVGGLTNFASFIIEGTDYTYWFNKVLVPDYDNLTNDPFDKSPWFYGDHKGNPWDKYKKYGFYTVFFKDMPQYVESMTLTIKFNLKNAGGLISNIAAENATPVSYKFTVSRNSINNALSFTDIERVQ